MSAPVSDEIVLTNDAQGKNTFTFRVWANPFANQASAHGAATTSGLNIEMGYPMPKAGRVLAFAIAGFPALSASGFVSGTFDAALKINSASICSTNPSINMYSSSAQASAAGIAPASTEAGGGVSGVLNNASASFNAGDVLSYDWNTRSAGSAAAGVAGHGMYVYASIVFNAV